MIKLINYIIKNYGFDKILHILVGISFGLIFPLVLPFYMSFIVSSVIFILKEVYDIFKPKPSGFDLQDLIVDYVGLIIGFVLLFIISVLFFNI
jgi:VanZ family protein